ncbi:MAG TPA: tetratricopeptide repeat protein [Verrucomicrobiota bacterium]|nr:tetratricopeptide repeat protein [Verrucomicrobiota bacterium]
MIALLTDMLRGSSPLWLLFAAFAIWMFVDAIRRREWLWAIFIFIFPILNAVLYFFLVYRVSAGPALRGFELPGAHDRRRIKELEDQIHHLDKSHHHRELGDIYFHQGKLAKAEACYRAALERDPDDPDTLAHYGQCLLRQQRTTEALPYLERVCASQPDHDYGHSLMALAEAYAAVGRTDDAIRTFQRVLEQHSYARARVQLAELYAKTGQPDLARAELKELISDDSHAPDFQRKRDRAWMRRARQILDRLPAQA